MIEALLEASRTALRTGMTVHMPTGADAKNWITIQPEGRPPPNMGEWHVTLDESGVNSTEKVSLREVYELAVYVTRRTGDAPRDRWDEQYLRATKGLRDLERSVIRLLHNSHVVRAAANTLAGFPGAGTGDIFQQPLWYVGRGPTQFMGGDWVGAEPESQMFAVRRLRFQGAVRVQAVDIMH